MIRCRLLLMTLTSFVLLSCARMPLAPITTMTPLPSLPAHPTVMLRQKGAQFPTVIDPARSYLFYLHGKIIEDQGLPAVSPEYGEYQYHEILKAFRSYGFVVISEQRARDTDSREYANRVGKQVGNLLQAGIPAESITLVGASKGAAITIFVSNLLRNEDLNYVILGICHPDVLAEFKRTQVVLTGNVLSIYDSVDPYAGSCRELFLLSKGRGLAMHNEITLEIGDGHGILYKPLDEWITPAVEWAKNQSP